VKKTPVKKTPVKKTALPRDDLFESIAADVISVTEAVECDFDTFVEGLRTIRAELDARLTMALAEQRSSTSAS